MPPERKLAPEIARSRKTVPDYDAPGAPSAPVVDGSPAILPRPNLCHPPNLCTESDDPSDTCIDTGASIRPSKRSPCDLLPEQIMREVARRMQTSGSRARDPPVVGRAARNTPRERRLVIGGFENEPGKW